MGDTLSWRGRRRHDSVRRGGRPSAPSRGRRRRLHALATRTPTAAYEGDDRRRPRRGGADTWDDRRRSPDKDDCPWGTSVGNVGCAYVEDDRGEGTDGFTATRTPAAMMGQCARQAIARLMDAVDFVTYMDAPLKWS